MPAGGFVYVDADRAIHALEASSGKEVWTRRTRSIPQAVDAGRVYYTDQNTDFKYFVQAMEPRTGASLGTLHIADANSLAPYGALAAGGGQLYVPVEQSHDFLSGVSNSKNSALCAVDVATGHKVWCSAWQYERLNAAVYKEGLVFITSTGEGNRFSALYGFRGAPPNSYTP
jgi:outer membrane protein assembly factor BamB